MLGISSHKHIIRRKQIHKKKDYPHSNKLVRYLDNTCLLFSVLMPATTIPQIYQIYKYQNASGVSMLMWILYLIASIPFMFYGFVHKEKPLIILNILWIIAQITIIVGIIMYG